MAVFFAGTDPEMSVREKKNMERIRNIASQGMVLLKNDGLLPVKHQKSASRVAAFGTGVRRTIKGGTGSGDVNARININIEQGLIHAGFTVTSEDWLSRYDRAFKNAQEEYVQRITAQAASSGVNIVIEMFNHPFAQPDTLPILPEDMQDSDVALYVISRSSGEGKDREVKAGDYYLSEEEKNNIRTLIQKYGKIIVLLNIGGVIDTSFLRNQKGVGAILLISQAGNLTGDVLADVLTGKVTPSGHLTDTWAEDYHDYPSADTFGYRNGDLDDEFYSEGIYVGYRYFDTFGIKPAYPFGYGLSYTDFSLSEPETAVDDNNVRISVNVTNIGSKYSGREVVQVYCSAPAGELEKPWQVLAGYTKTSLLLPGESQRVCICYL